MLAALPAPARPTDTAFYLQHCVRACEGGVERSHILPFATDGALLMEVFTHDGIGTMVVDEKLESLREATADDVGGILQLIEPFERDGTLVRRERTEIERDIANYTRHRTRRHHFRLCRAIPLSRVAYRRNGGTDRGAACTRPRRRRAHIEAHRTACPRDGPGQHLRAHHAHDALVHQAWVCADRPRAFARGAKEANTTGTGARRCWSRSWAEPLPQYKQKESGS